MSVVGIDLLSDVPLDGAEAVGAPGPYRVIRGVVRFAFDPQTPAARRIVDLERASVSPDGRVHAVADLQVVAPTAPADGNRGLLYVVANRGGAGELPFASRPGFPDPMAPLAATDGFLLRGGWTVAWSGWQWDVMRTGSSSVGFDAPAPAEIPAGTVRVMFRAATASHAHPLDETSAGIVMAGAAPSGYPAVGDNESATLRVRAAFDDPGVVVARERWQFARDEDGRAVPDPRWVWSDDGFEEGRIYEVHYRTDRAPVVGTGLLAVRDAVAHLRYGSDSPVAGRIDRVLALGISQSGRYLRQFLHDGMNVDEVGRPVFDGMLVHVAGSRRGDFNDRFAAPGVTWTMGNGSRAPYSTADLLARHAGFTGGNAPRVVCTNSSFEYWRGDAALSHCDGARETDIEDPPGVRHYLFAGSDHVGALPIGRLLALEHPPTEVDSGALLRCAFVNLDRWVSDGIEPPPSRVPRFADCTMTTRDAVLAAFAARDIAIPDPGALHPATLVDKFAPLVSATDDDGNERAGIRLPVVAVPVASYTGWNAFRVPLGTAQMAPEFVGAAMAFAPAIVARRYADRDAVRAEASEAARALVVERLLLDDDVDAVVDAAVARFEAREASEP